MVDGQAERMEALRLGLHVWVDCDNDCGGDVVVAAGGDGEGEGLAGELDDAGAVELVVFEELP